jgi:hypothetical protein
MTASQVASNSCGSLALKLGTMTIMSFLFVKRRSSMATSYNNNTGANVVPFTKAEARIEFSLSIVDTASGKTEVFKLPDNIWFNPNKSDGKIAPIYEMLLEALKDSGKSSLDITADLSCQVVAVTDRKVMTEGKYKLSSS